MECSRCRSGKKCGDYECGELQYGDHDGPPWLRSRVSHSYDQSQGADNTGLTKQPGGLFRVGTYTLWAQARTGWRFQRSRGSVGVGEAASAMQIRARIKR